MVTTEETDNALFVGGPWHGRVAPVRAGARAWVVMVWPEPYPGEHVSETTSIETVHYFRNDYIAPGSHRRIAFVVEGDKKSLEQLEDARRRGGDGDLVVPEPC